MSLSGGWVDNGSGKIRFGLKQHFCRTLLLYKLTFQFISTLLFSQPPTKPHTTHHSRQVVSDHKTAYSSKAKLFTLISRHKKIHWAQLQDQLGTEMTISLEAPATTLLDKQCVAIKQHFFQNQKKSTSKRFPLICIHKNMHWTQPPFGWVAEIAPNHLVKQFLATKQYNQQKQSWLI